MAVFDTKRVAKQTSSPEPAAEGAMTLVAPQAAHAEAGVLLLRGLKTETEFCGFACCSSIWRGLRDSGQGGFC